jgi:hypothetical protein
VTAGLRPAPLRRTVHAGAITLPKKSNFDLTVNSVQPLLRSFGSASIVFDFSFQLCHLIFSRAELIRKLLSHFQRVSAVVFGDARGFIEQLQDCLSCLVELVGIIRGKRITVPFS